MNCVTNKGFPANYWVPGSNTAFAHVPICGKFAHDFLGPVE